MFRDGAPRVAKLGNFEQALEHHIQEEEGKIFVLARSILTDHEAEQIGRAFVALKPKIREEGIMKTTFDLIVNLMPPRFSRFIWGDEKQNIKSA